MLRMMDGAPYSRQIMHCLLARGQRLISEHQSFSLTPTPCPLLPHYMQHNEQSHYCWAFSLIQYLQAADANIYTTSLFPKSTINTECTQTPLHTYFNIDNDAPLTLDNILDFENSYHIYFVEELFPFPPSHPTTFITHLLQLFPLKYHAYIQKVTLLAFQN